MKRETKIKTTTLIILIAFTTLGYASEKNSNQESSRYIELDYKGIQFNKENVNIIGLLIGNVSKKYHLGFFGFYNLSPHKDHPHLFEDYFHLYHFEGLFFEYSNKLKKYFTYSIRGLAGLSFSHVTEVDLDVAQSGLSPAWVLEPAFVLEYSVSKAFMFGAQLSYINIIDNWNFSPNYYMGSINVKVVL